MSYKEGKIYRIWCGDDEYIGSSCQKYLNRRFVQHCDNHKRWKNGKFYFLSSFILFEKHGVENCKIELIELFPCESKGELLTREKEIIQSRVCVNQRSPIRTKEERKKQQKEKAKRWYEANREKALTQTKQWHEINKEAIAAKGAVKYTCECGAITTIINKARHERTKKHISFISIV
jgi:hypothetical protein